MFTLNCKGQLLSLSRPVIMGIINATPDSFFTGNRKPEALQAVDMAGAMLEAGAKIIDLGAQSTRPGSDWLTASEETDRLLPVLDALIRHFPEIIISIDTFHADVAKVSIDHGAAIINDISGGNLDENMIPTVGSYGNVPYICMHMKGTPQTMTKENHYENMVKEVMDFFIQKIEICRLAGIKDVIVDPGYGFAKNLQQNYELLRRLPEFQILQKPLLVGISRKGMIYKPLKISAENALNGTTVLNTLALQNGADILRVHDVEVAVQAVKLMELYAGE